MKCKPKGVASFNEYFYRYRYDANRRGIEWAISKRYFKNLTSSNCSYCGDPPSLNFQAKRYNGGYLCNGIDRIDNNLGYIESNVVPCCTVCNMMKKKLTHNEFISKIKQIWLFVRKDEG